MNIKQNNISRIVRTYIMCLWKNSTLLLPSVLNELLLIAFSLQVAKMMGLVIGAPNLFYIPGFTIRRLTLSECLRFYLMPAGNFLDYMIAVINPFIYSWQSKDFNKAYRKLLHVNHRT